jgi:hypothetical protein
MIDFRRRAGGSVSFLGIDDEEVSRQRRIVVLSYGDRVAALNHVQQLDIRVPVRTCSLPMKHVRGEREVGLVHEETNFPEKTRHLESFPRRSEALSWICPQ